MILKRRKAMIVTHILALLFLFLLSIFIGMTIGRLIWPDKAHAQIIDPSPAAYFGLTTKPQPGQDGEAVGEITLSKEKLFFQKIFGSSWKIAFSVAEHECGHTNPRWPNCINSWGFGEFSGEHSVGLGQINLARNSGKGAWVHADKIPGETIGQKEIWLMNWKQNIMAMFIVSKGGTDFGPWTAYSNKNYLQTLKDL